MSATANGALSTGMSRAPGESSGEWLGRPAPSGVPGAAVTDSYGRRLGDGLGGGGIGPDDRGTAGSGNGTKEGAATGIDLEGRNHFVPRLHGTTRLSQEKGETLPPGWAICACGGQFSVTRLTLYRNNGCQSSRSDLL
jgi:hypothetical protein